MARKEELKLQSRGKGRYLMVHDPVARVTRFDILISDPYPVDDPFTTIEGTVALSMEEVWAWLSEAGDWSFQVVAHGDHDHLFIAGRTYDVGGGMKAAVEGQQLIIVGSVDEADINDLSRKLRQGEEVK